MLFHPPVQEVSKSGSLEKIQILDPFGFLIFIGSVIMLLLALQWGGATYPWRSSIIVGLFCGFGGMLTAFVFWLRHKGDEAIVPHSLLKQRTVLCSALVACVGMGSLQLCTYYLPIWFQVIKDATPTKSGIMYFPSVLGNILLSIVAGVLGSHYSSFHT